MPSTNWKELAPPGEEERFTRYAAQLRALQKKKAAKQKAARALHAKTLAGVRAELQILDALPAHASHGIFAQAKTYQAYVRFSNGSGMRQSDRVSDVRGVAIKVLGVPGPKALPGPTSATTQDFLAINAPTTPFHTADEFVAVVRAAATPKLALFRIIGALGLTRARQILKYLLASRGAATAALAGTTFYSALPIRSGPYAVRFALFPEQAQNVPVSTKGGANCLGDDVTERLKSGPLSWEMRLQFFEEEARTPIEDASVDWGVPYLPVARLTLPQQDAHCPEGKELAERIEQLSFDPWHALVEHTPLGGMMRARKQAYYASVQERAAAEEP